MELIAASLKALFTITLNALRADLQNP